MLPSRSALFENSIEFFFEKAGPEFTSFQLQAFAYTYTSVKKRLLSSCLASQIYNEHGNGRLRG